MLRDGLVVCLGVATLAGTAEGSRPGLNASYGGVQLKVVDEAIKKRSDAFAASVRSTPPRSVAEELAAARADEERLQKEKTRTERAAEIARLKSEAASLESQKSAVGASSSSAGVGGDAPVADEDAAQLEELNQARERIAKLKAEVANRTTPGAGSAPTPRVSFTFGGRKGAPRSGGGAPLPPPAPKAATPSEVKATAEDDLDRLVGKIVVPGS